MNQTFYLPRWWMLVIRHWAENRRRYLFSLLAVAGLLLAWYGFQFVMDRSDIPRKMSQFVIYLIGLFLAGCIYASTIFSPLGNKKEAIQYLSVPASQLEKFLCAWFYAVFLFFILYTIVFYAVDIAMVKMAIRSGVGYSSQRIAPDYYAQRLGIPNIFATEGIFADDVHPTLFLLAFLAFQSVFILGSVYFSRYAFIKTMAALLLLTGVCALFVVKGVGGHLPKDWHLNGLLEWGGYAHGGETLSIVPERWVEDTVTFLVRYALPPIFWYIAYTRLKEKEV